MAAAAAVVLALAVAGVKQAQGAPNLWTGSVDGNWGTGANWAHAVIASDTLTWDATSTANKISTNNLIGQTVAGFNFAGAPDGIVLNGNDLTGSDTASVLLGGRATINPNVTFSGVNPSFGSSASDGQDITFNGVLSGGSTSFNLKKGFHTFNGANTFSCPVIIGGGTGPGTLIINTLMNSGVGNPQSLGTGSLVQFANANNGSDRGNLVYNGGATSTDKGFQLGSADNAASGGGVYSSGSGAVTWTGTQTLQTGQASGTRVFTLGGFNADDNAWQSAIQNNTAAGLLSLTKSGTGKWVLTAANTFTGGLTVNGGTLLLDYASNATVVNSANALVLGGATLELKGKAGEFSTAQALGNVTFTADTGLSKFKVNQNGGTATALTLGTVTTTPGRTAVLFDRNGSASSVTIGTAITPDSGTSGRILIRASGGAYDFAVNNNNAANPLEARGATATIGATEGSATLDYVFTDSGTIGSGVPTAISAQSLRIAPTLDNQTMTISNVGAYACGGVGGLIVDGGGLLYDGGANDFTIASAAGANGVSLKLNNGNTGFMVHHLGTGTLTIGERVYLCYAGASPGTTGSSAPLGLTGTGLIDWKGGHNSTAAIVIHGAVVRISGTTDPVKLDTTSSGKGAGNLVLNGGGIIEAVNGDITRNVGSGGGAVQWTGDGGFSANGTTRAVQLNNGTAPIVWGSTSFVADHNALVLCSSYSDSTIDFQNGLSLGSLQRVVRVGDGAATVDAKLSGVLASGLGGGLVKEGAGLLELTAANTYNGQTWVKAGELRVSSTTGSGVQGTPKGGLVTVFSGAAISGTGTVDSLTVNTGGKVAVYGAGVPSKLNVTGAMAVGSGATLDLSGLSSLADGDQVIVQCGSRTGTFDTITPSLPPDREIQYTSTSIVLKHLVADTTPPPVPTLVSPTNTSSIADTTPTFTWNTVTDASGISRYDILIDDVTNSAGTGVSYTPAVALSLGAHNWQVRAVDNATPSVNTGDWSSVWTVTIATDTAAPAAPILVSPTNLEITADTTPTFTWNAVTDASGISRYDILIDDTTNSAGPGTTYTPAGALSLGAHNWQVRAVDNATPSVNTGDWSSVWTVTITASSDTTAPDAPTLVSPTNGEHVATPTPTFSWNAVTDASGIDHYEILIDATTHSTGPATSFIPPSLLGLGAHNWQVRAVDGATAANTGAWSGVSTVTVDSFPLYWDGNGDTAPNPSGNGAWDSSTTSNWNTRSDYSGAYCTWAQGCGEAWFPSLGGATGTVTISGTVTVSRITVSTNVASQVYTVTNGAIQLTGAAQFSPEGDPVALVAPSLNIHSGIGGADGLSISNRLKVNSYGTNTYTGPTSLGNHNAKVTFLRSAALPATTILRGGFLRDGYAIIANSVTSTVAGIEANVILEGDTAHNSVLIMNRDSGTSDWTLGTILPARDMHLVKRGGYTQVFSGVSRATQTLKIEGGVLSLNCATNNAAVADENDTPRATSITLSGGSLRLDRAEQIQDAANLTVAGGVFNLNGFSETLSNLTVTANSTIDFGDGAVTNTYLGSATWTSGLLAITNWSGMGAAVDHLCVVTLPADSFLLHVQFSGNPVGARAIARGSYYEIRPREGGSCFTLR
jgi:autotransporter-associated beta strand protein